MITVDSFVGKTPSIRFIGKTSLISDRFGEKLSQPFVTTVLQSLQSKYDLAWPFAMLAPDADADAYTLYLTGHAPETLPTDLDRALYQNPHYAYCRDLGQLKAPNIVQVSPEDNARYFDRLQSLGQRLGDIKLTSLSPLDNWGSHFNRNDDRRACDSPHKVG